MRPLLYLNSAKKRITARHRGGLSGLLATPEIAGKRLVKNGTKGEQVPSKGSQKSTITIAEAPRRRRHIHEEKLGNWSYYIHRRRRACVVLQVNNKKSLYVQPEGKAIPFTYPSLPPPSFQLYRDLLHAPTRPEEPHSLSNSQPFTPPSLPRPAQ